jgi:multicomponent K+:H+ antiporter subunit F
MMDTAIVIAAVGLGVSLLLTLWRLIKGPSMADRILALDTMAINAIGVIVLVCITLASRVYMEAAILIAMLGFVGTVALSRAVSRGDVISEDH